MTCQVCCSQEEQRFSEFKKAAESKCQTCRIIVNGIKELAKCHRSFGEKRWEDHLTLGLWSGDSHKRSVDLIAGRRDAPPPQGYAQQVLQAFDAEFFTVEDHAVHSQDESLFPRRRLLEIEDCSAFSQQSLHRCLSEHKCGINDNYLPKRLIDVSRTDSTDSVKIIDHARDRIVRNTKYVALSYCWGEDSEAKSQMITMDKNTLKDMCKGISVTTLPPVFRDAVTMTRALNIQYLWIDALCIAQGDIEEWKIESLTMKDVYSNAVITVVAAAAANCAETFLPTSESRLKWKTVVAENQLKVYARLHIVPKTKYQLDTRGWCLQELLLSRRILYFHDSQVVFSCMEDINSEIGQPVLSSPMYPVGDGVRLQKKWAREIWQNDLRPSSALQNWHQIVQQYSERNLTRSEDKLPALSGLAAAHKLMRREHGDKYLAGLWESSLIKDLAWEARGPVKPTKAVITLEAILPSWSWISVERKVRFRSLSPLNLCSLEALNGQSAIREANEFGDVVHGKIRLRGSTMVAQVTGLRANFQLNLANFDQKQAWDKLQVLPPLIQGPIMLDTNIGLSGTENANETSSIQRNLSNPSSELSALSMDLENLLLACRNEHPQSFTATYIALTPSLVERDTHCRVGIWEQHWRYAQRMETQEGRDAVVKEWAASLPVRTFDIT